MISIIIPVWNVTEDLAQMTKENIEQIWQVSKVQTEVLVIDNGSPFTDHYRMQVYQRFIKNEGIAHAWNEGAKVAHGEVLCFLNNDVFVQKGWDSALFGAALDRPQIVFPYTDYRDGNKPRAPEGNVCGWCFMLSKDTFNRIGEFDEQFYPAFYEDTDYFHRAWKDKIPLRVIPEAVVSHTRRTTASKLPNMNEIFVKNRIKYSTKHGLDWDLPPPFYTRSLIK